MAKSVFVQPGEQSIELVAPGGGVVTKTAILIGSLLVIPLQSAAVGEKFSAQVDGVWKMPKATGGGTDITQGAKLFWDDSAKVVTKTAGANKIAGICVLAAATGDTQAWVLLDGDALVYGDESAAAAAVAAAVATTNVGAGDAGKLLKLDAAGKAAGRVLETDGTKLDAIEAGAQLTNAARVAAAGAVMSTTYDAQSVLVAVSDDTPVAVVVAAKSLVGRGGTGNVGAMPAAITLDPAAPALDSTLVTAPAGNAIGRNVFGSIELTTTVGNGAIVKASVETAPASGVFKETQVMAAPVGAIAVIDAPYSFWVPPGCRYKFLKIVGGAADAAFTADGYNFLDI